MTGGANSLLIVPYGIEIINSGYRSQELNKAFNRTLWN